MNIVAVGADGSRRMGAGSALGLRAGDPAFSETVAYLETLLSSAPAGLLFVDREFRYLRVNERIAAIHGSASVEEHLGHTIAEVVPALWPQLEASYRSVLESGVPVLDRAFSGLTAEDVGRRHDWLESIYPVRLAGKIIGLAVVVTDVTELNEHEATLVALTEAAVDAIAAAAEARDPDTAGHQQRVDELSVAIAHELGVDQNDIYGIRMAARIHDIGKLSTPSEILTKPGVLRASELALVREHAQAGYDIIRGIVFLWPPIPAEQGAGCGAGTAREGQRQAVRPRRGPGLPATFPRRRLHVQWAGRRSTRPRLIAQIVMSRRKRPRPDNVVSAVDGGSSC
ncbi:MAG: PAS domain-containing protein [Ilumatobacteraceae bacterium]